ncbi:MAG: ABC transporter ATP-binding protein [Candidatus Heimdallarchaeota archaeon]
MTITWLVQSGFQAFQNEHTAIHNVTFNMYRVEFLSIVGPSGCGKTTLLKIIIGLEKSDIGEVLLDGKKIEKPTPDIGLMFQMFSLYPWCTVSESVVLGLEIMGVPRTKFIQEAARLFELVGISGYADMYHKELSGGQVQWVEIARPLSTNPLILLLDESLAHLDAQTRNYMQGELLDIW